MLHSDHVGAAASRVQGGLRLTDRCAGAKLAERPEDPAGSIALLKRAFFERRPDVDGAPEIDPVEPIRRDAGYGTLAPVDSDLSVASLGVGAELVLPHAMADDDAIRQRQLKELRQLRGQGGDGHHRRAVAEPDGDSGLARGTEPVERPVLRFEGKEGLGTRPGRRRPARRAQTPTRPAGFREWGRCGSSDHERIRRRRRCCRSPTQSSAATSASGQAYA